MSDEITTSVARTTAGLRNALFDELDALRSGKSNPQKARATALICNTVLNSVEVEIEFHKYVRDVYGDDVSSKTPVLELGHDAIRLAE